MTATATRLRKLRVASAPPVTLDAAALTRWRLAPWQFVEECCIDPETGAPFQLLPAERLFMEHAFQRNSRGRWLYPELIFSAPKKSGKTGFAALFTLVSLLLFGGMYPEALIAANDREQAVGRVFTAIRRIVETSPVLAAEAKVLADTITFEATDASIKAITSSYSSAAGANANLTVFDELWAFDSEKDQRLFDECVPPPTRKLAARLTVTYAGFEGESSLLEGLYKRGMAQPLVGPDLHAGKGILLFWSHVPIAPWQTDEWVEEMRGALRPAQFLRMIQNEFTTSEASFIDMELWDACVDPGLRPTLSEKSIFAWIGVDASVVNDWTAIVVVGWDRVANRVRLLAHRIFKPTRADPIDFEQMVERTIVEFCGRFRVREVRYDPQQMVAVAQRLASTHRIPMVEYQQTIPNLTAMSSNLLELIRSRALHLYPDAEMRASARNAVAKESARGWRLAKADAGSGAGKIDVIVALAMAAHAAVEQGLGGPPPLVVPRQAIITGMTRPPRVWGFT
jgi:phage terminase large subunit-like protein